MAKLRLPSAPLTAGVTWKTLPMPELVMGLCLFLLSVKIAAGGEYSLGRAAVMFVASGLIILYGAYCNPYAPVYCYAFFCPIFTAFGTSFALILGGIVLVLLNRRKIEWDWRFSAPGVAFCIWSLASLLWADQRYFGQDSYIAQAAPPMLLAMVIAGIRDPLFRRNLVLLIVGACTMGSAFSVLHHRLGMGDYGGGRTFALIRPDIFSAWEVFGLVGAVAWLVAGRPAKWLRLLLVLSLLLIIAGTGLSGERAAILAGGLGVLMISICRRHLLKGISIIALIGFAGVLLYLVLPGMFDPVLARFQTIHEDRGSDRLEIWGAAFKVFAESPLIGVGTENFRFAVGRYYGEEYLAHSIYIGTLIELGVIGFALMIWWFAALLVKAWRAEDRLWVFPLLLAYIFHAAFLHEFYFPCFWLALGLAEGALPARGRRASVQPRSARQRQDGPTPAPRPGAGMCGIVPVRLRQAGARLARSSMRPRAGARRQ